MPHKSRYLASFGGIGGILALIKTVIVLFLVFPSLVVAKDFCERISFDPEFPAGIEGNYEIIGRAPSTGASYTGRLILAIEKSTYTITRSINGKPVSGEAWIEECGADKIPYLYVRYDTKPISAGNCRLGNDGDNYYRVTCRTTINADKTWRGLEAWFQNP